MWKRGATDTGNLMLLGGFVVILFLAGAFNNIGSTVQPQPNVVCTPDQLPPGVSTYSFTAQSRERGTPGTVVTLSYNGDIGARNFRAQAGATAVTVNPGDSYKLMLYNTTYFNTFKQGNLACAGSGALGQEFTVANIGGASTTIMHTNGSLNSATNATCQQFETAGGTASWTVRLQGNESKAYVTTPSDLGTPGYSESTVAILEIPPGSIAAYATNFDATPTTLSGCSARTRIGSNSSGWRQLIWDCPGNLGLTSEGAPDTVSHILTIQLNSGFLPQNLISDGNGTLALRFYPKEVFQDTRTGEWKTDFETNLGAVVDSNTYAGQVNYITICP